MTPEIFRSRALSLPNVREVSLLGSNEFRVKDKAFATVGWPEPGWAVIRLAPDDQASLISCSRAFVAEPGGRGKRGVTRIKLADADEVLVERALSAAWRRLTGRTANLSV